MKKILLTVALLAAFVVNVGAQAVIKYDKSSHDFGKFDEEKKQTVVFAFTNTGDEPLVIQQVMTTCGCTVADYTKTPIPAGKKGQIKVTYNGKGKPKGFFRKVITVRSNATNVMTRIYISGDMLVKE